MLAAASERVLERCGLEYDDTAGMYYDANSALYYDQVYRRYPGACRYKLGKGSPCC